jgi:hypothetical protein
LTGLRQYPRLPLWEKNGIFSHKRRVLDMSQSVESKVVARIYGHGRGWAFSPIDFQDLGRVDMALMRLTENGRIRRVIRGIYDYPRFSDLLQQNLSPDIHQVAMAIARKFGWRIQPDGTSAMNLIGLTTQVPSQFMFTSDGPDRKYKIDKTSLEFRHTALKEIGFRIPESGIIVHALKVVGQDRISPETIDKIRSWLPEDKRSKVLKDTDRVTGWVFAAIQKICKESQHG